MHTIENRKFFFSMHYGEVLESSTNSTTHVTGHGGGGSISTDYQGRVSGRTESIKISSHTKTETNVWIRNQHGEEEEWVFPFKISVRAGHKLLIIAIGEEGGAKYRCTLVNATTGTMTELNNAASMCQLFGLIPPLEGVPHAAIILIGLLILAFLVGSATSAGAGFVALLLGAVGSMLFVNSKKNAHNAVQYRIERDMGAMIQEVPEQARKFLDWVKNNPI